MMNRIPSQKGVKISAEDFSVSSLMGIPKMKSDDPMNIITIPVLFGSPLMKRCSGLLPPTIVVCGPPSPPAGLMLDAMFIDMIIKLLS